MEFSDKDIFTFDEQLQKGPDATRFEDFPDATVAMDFVNYCLSTVYRDGAFIHWWNKSHQRLGNRSPLDVWSESPQDVINLATSLANL